ncbi:Biotin_lipoyl domain-containing protein [Cephalotus follicularis]|uniref:Biotin_lipoyl domain-containing protein n=1 Tax=Cephalotus follicularis TaxID=3775 RepID=A0A1Q3CPT7_CEPFO|nr:Biotin_lipoyl domain-containing protein [Cephalotus follicularis]
MPAFSSTMTEGKIVSWIKFEGDAISKGESVVVVESDKANMDVETFYDEILAAIIVPEGETALVGAPIGLLAETQDEVAEAKAKAKTACSSTAPQTVTLTPPLATATPAPAIKSLLNGLSNVQVYLTMRRGMAKRARVPAYKVC